MKIEEGSIFSRLTVIRRDGSTAYGEAKWLCMCACGRAASVKGKALRAGITKSCGCLNREALDAAATKHGGRYSSEYQTWGAMKARCNNPQNLAFKNYGGRGISVCKEWESSFEQFLKDMGPRPAGTSIDRYPDKNGNYEPGNCRWATKLQQTRNRRNTLDVDLISAAEKLGISYGAAYQRMRRGKL